MQVILYLATLLVVLVVGILVYDKFLHPLLFKEELEETLEDAVENKTRRQVQAKAQEILEEENDS